MTNILSIKEIIQHETLWIPKGMKQAISVSIAFSVGILIRNKNIIPRNAKQKTVELQVLAQSWVIQEIMARSNPYK